MIYNESTISLQHCRSTYKHRIGSFPWWKCLAFQGSWVPMRSCKASMHLPMAPPKTTANTNWARSRNPWGKRGFFGTSETNGNGMFNISYQSLGEVLYNGKNQRYMIYNYVYISNYLNVEQVILYNKLMSLNVFEIWIYFEIGKNCALSFPTYVSLRIFPTLFPGLNNPL